MLRQYDPKEVTMIYAGQIMEGFAEGTFISIERNEDSANLSVGAQGDGTRTISNNRSGRITLTLQQTSPSNATLSAQHSAMELAGAGIATAILKDNGGNDLANAAKAWPVKPATMAYAAESSNREWILETDNLEMFVLGQSI